VGGAGEALVVVVENVAATMAVLDADSASRGGERRRAAKAR